jgi:hypothetical protein
MSKTSIVQKVLALCVVGAFAALGASCGSESDCASDQVLVDSGQCADKCSSEDQCASNESCQPYPGVSSNVCVRTGDNPDGGMDGGVDDGGNGDDDGGNGDDDGGNGDADGGRICESLENCAQSSCANQNGIDLAACIEANCETELNNCPQAVGLSCSAYVDCLRNCPDGDDSCRNDCQSNLGELGRIRVNAYGACLEENNCESLECRLTTCGDQYYACFPEQAPGSQTCDDNFRCTFGLIEGEQCEDNQTVQDQIDYSNMINCADSNGCIETTPDGRTLNIPCMIRECPMEVSTCGLSGNRSCSEVEACTRSVNNTNAFIECLLTFSSTQEANHWDDLRTCVNNNCSDAADPTLCAQSECGSERDTCGLNGTNTTCADMWNCLRGTNGDSMCDTSADGFGEYFNNNYVFEGPAQAQSDFFALNNCRADNNCLPDDQTCLEPDCSSELDACGVSFSN